MAIPSEIVWASNAADIDITPPSADKQMQGWVQETPAHQHMNWFFNNVCNRLNKLEDRFMIEVLVSEQDERVDVITAGEDFTLSANYVVGGNKLRVFLDGILCPSGDGNTYVEVGRPGELSNIIRFNDDIPTTMELRIEMPVKAYDNIVALDKDGMLSEDSVAALVQQVMRGLNLDVAFAATREDSKGGTRPAPLGNGDTFKVSEYIVGAKNLFVYIDGMLQTPDKDYEEVGKNTAKSTSIILRKDVPTSATITICTQPTSARLVIA